MSAKKVTKCNLSYRSHSTKDVNFDASKYLIVARQLLRTAFNKLYVYSVHLISKYAGKFKSCVILFAVAIFFSSFVRAPDFRKKTDSLQQCMIVVATIFMQHIDFHAKLIRCATHHMENSGNRGGVKHSRSCCSFAQNPLNGPVLRDSPSVTIEVNN